MIAVGWNPTKRDGSSLHQPGATALAPDDYIRARAQRADDAAFEAALAAVPDTPPQPGDEV